MSDQNQEEVIDSPDAHIDTFDYGDKVDDANEDAEDESDATSEAETTAKPEPAPAPRYKVKVAGQEVEVELDELLNGYSRNSDYTKKSQEVAESRRALEARQAQVEQQAQLQQDVITEIAQLHNIDSQLAQYAKIDWNQASIDDPVQTQQWFIQQQQLRDARAGLVSSVQQKEAQKAQIKNQQAFEAQQATAKQIEEGQAMLAREIKGWSPELAQKLAKFAADDGWTKSQIEAITPAQVKSLHRAYIGTQIIQKQTVAPTPKPPPPPVPKVSAGGSASSKKVSEMTMEEYARMRRKQRS